MTAITELQRPSAEVSYDLQVLFDDVVKREIDHHPELNSRRKKLIFIQETFGWNIIEMAHRLGTTEQISRRFLSRRGMRKIEHEEFAERLDGTFAITSIVAAHVKGLLPRRDTLNRPNALLEQHGVKAEIDKGEMFKAVYIAERSFRQVHEQE